MRAIFLTFFILFSMSLASAKILENPNLGTLLTELQLELVSLEHTIDPLNKQYSCYHSGKAQSIADIIHITLQRTSYLSKKEIKNISNIFDRLKSISHYCSNNSKKITIQAMILLLKRRKVENKIKKIEHDLSGLNELEIVHGHELTIINNLKQLVASLPTQFGSIFSDDIAASQFKPESCLAVGKIVPLFEISLLLKTETMASVDNETKTLVRMIKTDQNLHFTIEELKSICFDERGFAKYIRDVKNLQQKFQITEKTR